jgi:hypothetical protein
MVKQLETFDPALMDYIQQHFHNNQGEVSDKLVEQGYGIEEIQDAWQEFKSEEPEFTPPAQPILRTWQFWTLTLGMPLVLGLVVLFNVFVVYTEAVWFGSFFLAFLLVLRILVMITSQWEENKPVTRGLLAGLVLASPLFMSLLWGLLNFIRI